MRLQPRQLAIEYYFGDLQYWKLPSIAVQALEEGYDGPALRTLAGIAKPVLAEMDMGQIDLAFREMGVMDAPISKNNARLFLATQLAEGVMNGNWNVFDAATHLRIHLCELNDPTNEISELWRLAEEARNGPRGRWSQLEGKLREAFLKLLESRNKD